MKALSIRLPYPWLILRPDITEPPAASSMAARTTNSQNDLCGSSLPPYAQPFLRRRNAMNKYTWKPVASKETLVDLYVVRKLSLVSIAKLLASSPKAVSTSLKKAGIALFPPVNRHTDGDKCYAWRGGRSISSGGYVLCRAPSHPRATKRGKYVFEHILVVESHIGRYLIDGEVVHHRNGIKTDNREENLELLTKSQHCKLHRDPESGRLVSHGAE